MISFKASSGSLYSPFQLNESYHQTLLYVLFYSRYSNSQIQMKILTSLEALKLHVQYMIHLYD